MMPIRIKKRSASSLNHLFSSKFFRQSPNLRWYCDDFFTGSFPRCAACYVFIVDNRCVYVGSTVNMNVRMRAHRNPARDRTPIPWKHQDILVKYRPSKKYGDWLMLELRLIRRLKPVGNQKGVLCA